MFLLILRKDDLRQLGMLILRDAQIQDAWQHPEENTTAPAETSPPENLFAHPNITCQLECLQSSH